MSLTSLMVALLPMAIKTKVQAPVKEVEPALDPVKWELAAVKAERDALKLDIAGLRVTIQALADSHAKTLEAERAGFARMLGIERTANVQLSNENGNLRALLSTSAPPVMYPVKPGTPAQVDLLAVHEAMRDNLRAFCTCVPGRADMFRRMPEQPETLAQQERYVRGLQMAETMARAQRAAALFGRRD